MPKQSIQHFNLWTETISALMSDGVLLNSLGDDGQPNTMTIGWMTGGIIWGKPILIVLVRPSRHTFSRLEQVPEFTVNVLPTELRAALQICGTESGRKADKFARARLTPSPAQRVRVPVIEEALISYECSIVHRNNMDPTTLPQEIMHNAYAGGGFHRLYFGEVLATTATVDARARLGKVM
ncbi:MAG: flavin reductase family protein [Verrucomicrobia bacterium]|nr:flavin reductase family protein [Verrucomicrobiota bacterium]